MAIIKKHYCDGHKVKPSLLQVVKPLDANFLDLQMCIFKLTMETQAPKVMDEPFDTNLMIKLWVNDNALFIQQLSEYLKLVENTVVSVLGFIKDE
jgi:hypothetical protein